MNPDAPVTSTFMAMECLSRESASAPAPAVVRKRASLHGGARSVHVAPHPFERWLLHLHQRARPGPLWALEPHEVHACAGLSSVVASPVPAQRLGSGLARFAARQRAHAPAEQIEDRAADPLAPRQREAHLGRDPEWIGG